MFVKEGYMRRCTGQFGAVVIIGETSDDAVDIVVAVAAIVNV
jgi:hypothetical protein